MSECASTQSEHLCVAVNTTRQEFCGMRGTAPIHHASFLTPAGLSGPISSRHVRDPSGPRTRPGIPCCTSRSGLWHAWHDRHQRNFRRGSSSGKRRARRTGALIRAQGCHLRSIAGSAGHQCFGEIHGPASGPPPWTCKFVPATFEQTFNQKAHGSQIPRSLFHLLLVFAAAKCSPERRLRSI